MNTQSPNSWKPLLGGILAALVVLIGFNSFVILNPGQAGVLSILGKAQDGVLLEGIHLRPTFGFQRRCL